MNNTSGIWRMVVAMGLSGTIGLFVVMSGQPTQTVVFFRCLIGGLALLGWLTWQGAWRRLSGRAIGWLLLGAVALISNWLCLFSAYRLSSISIATVIYHVQPFFLIVLAALAQKELPAWNKLAWLALAFVGVAMISGITFHADRSAVLGGALLALVAAFLYALATVATRKLAGVPPAQIAGLQLLLGVPVLAPLADFSSAGAAWQSWSSLLILGLVHTGLMYNLLYAAFQRLPASMIASLSFIYPVVAILVDIAFFHTALSAIQMLGIFLVLVAVVGNQREWNSPGARISTFFQLWSSK
ncbi:MAG TPA: DMT family transporter [Candidatus Binatia bacterium]